MLTYDEVGDPGGTPVVYLHGTPDSRLARHPDDSLAARAGIRLLAVDRPGYGGTSPLAMGTDPDAFADDVVELLDVRGVEQAQVLAWSGGALTGLRLAGALGGGSGGPARVTGLMLVAGLVPRQAYDDPEVRAAGSQRLGLLELAETLTPAELAEAIVPLLAPRLCDRALALDHQREQRSPADQAALAQVPFALERMADSLVEAVRRGLAGVGSDLEAEVRPVGDALLGRVTVPVRLLYGSTDTVTPAAFGAWYTRRLPHARLDIVDGAGHYLPFTHWPEILAGIPRL